MADLTFSARVYGFVDGAVYLSGRTAEDDDSAVSVMVPLSVLERPPELGETLPVVIRIGAAPSAEEVPHA